MKATRMLALSGLGLLLAAVGGRRVADPARFDHWKHRKLFVSCETCHAGAVAEGAALYPQPAACANCHDGKLLVNGKALARVDWKAPSVEGLTVNLRFTHSGHERGVARRTRPDSSVGCMECHAQAGAPWMQVAEKPLRENCFSCHGLKVAHFAAPDTACATCHQPLAGAARLTRAEIARFQAPDTHKAPGFLTAKGHGAQAVSGTGVAASCATCHARDFCTQCHVNAPEVRTIQALAPDPRSTAIEAKLEAPADHRDAKFQQRHGGMSRKADATCVNCHTQQSCLSCHRSTPSVAIALHPAGPARGSGAQIVRTRPATHTVDFADRHGPLANATAKSCNACHARAECLDCHRPSAGSTDSYHPAGFLTRHPSAAYNRQSDCSECHNQKAFCTDCHAQAGFASTNGLLTGKFHDTKASFLLGHGQAARQSLETCATCHSEQDCLACHSAQTRRFNPHGPGFDAERLRRKNPQTCAACHGRAIPGR